MSETIETTGSRRSDRAAPRRSYNRWTSNTTVEDYSLRYAPRSFRKWTPYVTATAALGGIAYLADFAIGGSIAVTHGFANAVVAILLAAVVIFLTGIPIAYYSARYAIDMDLLTRGAGFGYLGSTLTSLIYASFTFIFFALEGSIMAQAFQLALHIPLPIGYLLSSLIVIPLVVFGMTALSKLQVWSQPIWAVLMLAPFVAIAIMDPGKYAEWTHFAGQSASGASLSLVGVGLGAGVALSLIAQIGEQADYLRFMPEKTETGPRRWWAAVLAAGPGWVVLGALKQLGGTFLAFLVAGTVGLAGANEPIAQFLGAYSTFLPVGALAVAAFFVILSQIKINVTNAYSGSLSWSNFFSRILHWHPGRVVWIFLNVGIALALMEGGVFGFLNTVLGFYSNVAIAWIGAITADLVINKPLRISPRYIEFKRAHLYHVNPVGFGSMIVASIVSILAFFNVFGATAQAFSPFLALVLAFVLSPVIAVATRGKYYIARPDSLPEPLMVDGAPSMTTLTCTVCGNDFERPDMASCPFHNGPICSLCCSLESTCHDQCKTRGPVHAGMPAMGMPSDAAGAPIPKPTRPFEKG
jgi:purine-cytosine permease-like protein